MATIGSFKKVGNDYHGEIATLVLEQVSIDRPREQGIVELEREVVAAFFGALRPGCTDLGSAHKNAMARSLVV